MAMTLQEAFYEVKFECEFRSSKGDAFQSFFARLMGLAYRTDFMACRPWGSDGDRKNDGFLKSKRQLFQVYAPIEMKASKAKAKISEDFQGAKEYWGTHFDSWVFVHNATDGLPPHIHKLLLEIKDTNPGFQLESWCLQELQLIFRSLSHDDKAAWFGPAVTDETKSNLGFADLRVVLESISTVSVSSMTDVKDVPAGKIEANALSEAIAQLLRAGMSKAPLVESFLSQWHDETLGERLAQAFSAEYRRLRASHTPDKIYFEIQTWVGGDTRRLPAIEMAMYAVIAYYFERCEIFEEPRGAAP